MNEEKISLSDAIVWATNLITNGEPIFSSVHTFGKDKGEKGEYLSEFILNNPALRKICCIKTVHNVYLRKENGMTTEVDVIAITEKGIFVIESKNYTGWIFGDMSSKEWTQRLPNGKKSKFYSPVLQNSSHIRQLSSELNLPKDMFVSYIVFSNDCTLKKVPQNTNDLKILNRQELLWSMQKDLQTRENVMTNDDVAAVYKRLNELTHVSNAERKEHINQVTDIKNGRICPVCGKKLVLRKGKYGNFYGCSGYPKCKYVLKQK